MIESIEDLNDADTAELLFHLAVYADPQNWLRTITQQGRELERLLAHLRKDFPALELAMITNLANHPSLQQWLATLRGNRDEQRDIEQPAVETEKPAEVAESPDSKNLLRLR